MALLIASLKASLAKHTPWRAQPCVNFCEASVLVLLLPNGALEPFSTQSRSPHVLYTLVWIRATWLHTKKLIFNFLSFFFCSQRTPHVGKHKGEVSFPGGKVDCSCDHTFIDTALREAWEEVGISSNDVVIVGEMNDFCVASGFIMHPVVGVFLPKDPSMKPVITSTREVAQVFTISLDELAKPELWLCARWPMDVAGSTSFPVFFFKYPGYNLWGATAHITLDLLKWFVFFFLCF